MEDVDTQELDKYDEDTVFLCDMCGDDHELLFLDSYLRDTFRGRGSGVHEQRGGSEIFNEESTI